jgi:SAM-dependent methyltransferase
MSGQTGVRADNPYSGRQPTSHERRAGRPWDASYLDGPAPWDTGRPQPAILRLAGEGAFRGAVLDAGCGTGENALHVASLGLHVLGVDVAETALSIARKKAADRGIDADFVVADAFDLPRLGRVFETVLDCGLFHALGSDERRDYVASLASVTGRGGHLYVLCFSDVGPGTWSSSHQSGGVEGGVQTQQRLERCLHQSGADPDKVRRAACTGLVGEDRTDLAHRIEARSTIP